MAAKMWIDLLAEQMPPAAVEARTEADHDWTRAADGLPVPLPREFRAFVDRWGTGTIGGFINLYTPAQGYHRVITLPDAVLSQADNYAQLKENHPTRMTLPVFPQPGSLMSFGVTDNGDYLGWVVGSGDADSWPVAVLDEEQRELQVFKDVTFGPFLLGVVTGSIRPEAFPEDLWDDTPLDFAPNPPATGD